MLDNYLKNVAIIGAAGKMGSGIALLLSQEMGRINAENNGKASGSHLYLIDTNEEALQGLYVYLKAQLAKFAEKNTIALREYYAERSDLVENGEIINAFTEEALLNVRLDTDLGKVKDSKLVFEAIIEDIDIKKVVYSKLNKICSDDTYFLTNTSSVPISILNDNSNLGNRIIGYHFYNPPAIQKLVEVITTQMTDKKLIDLSYELGTRLRKKLVPANDKAGFIGNGHFIWDGLFGLYLVSELGDEIEDYQAIYVINKITQEFMVRPMGIFQLIDYVGIDVYKRIMMIMRQYLNNDTIQNGIIDALLSKGVKGGQNADGSQKDGIIKYEMNKPVGFYSLKKGKYYMLDEGEWTSKMDKKIGELPGAYNHWKDLLRDRSKNEKLKAYFGNLFACDCFGCNLAKRYLMNSRDIADNLVKDGIANQIEDVNAVLENGFFHLYGPVNELY